MLAFYSHALDFSSQFDVKNADQKEKKKSVKIHLNIILIDLFNEA